MIMNNQTLEQLSVAIKIVPRLTQVQYTGIMGVLKAYYGHAGRPGLVGGSAPRSGIIPGGSGVVLGPIRRSTDKVNDGATSPLGALTLAMEHKQWTGVVHNVCEKNGGVISTELLAKEAMLQGKKETSLEEWDKVTQRALKSNLYVIDGKDGGEHTPQTKYRLKTEKELTDEGWIKDEENREIYYKVSLDQSGIKKGVCFSQRVTLMGDDDAIYKDEHYRFGNPESEKVAYKLDKELGLDIVPQTTVTTNRDGSTHSVQKWINNGDSVGNLYDKNGGPIKNKLKDESAPGKVLLLDLILGNSDRHERNIIVKGNRIYAIDNGAALQPFTVNLRDAQITGMTKQTLKLIASPKEDMQTNYGRLYLPSSYKDKLRKMIDSGQLEKLFSHSSYGRVTKQAMLIRAEDLIEYWDDRFYE